MSPARKMGEVVFTATSPKDDLYDLTIDQRAAENDLTEAQFPGALSRRRVPADVKVWVKDWDGRRRAYTGRR